MTGKQKAGKGSAQVNAGRDVVIISQATSESDIRGIVQAEIQLTLSNYKADALEKYLAKGNSMIEKLVGSLENTQDKLNAFSDPDFNFALRDAGRAVASNDSEYTEELLVDILASRAIYGGSSKVKIVTKKAIEAADKLTPETLNALTMVWVLLNIVVQPEHYFPVKFAMQHHIHKQALGAFKPVPAADWIDEAELLGLIEVDRGFGTNTKSYVELLSERFKKFLCPGISLNRWQEINAALQDQKVDIRIHVIEHPLKNGFVLVDCTTRDEFIAAVKKLIPEKATVHELIEEVANTNGFESEDAAAKQKLEDFVNKESDLQEVSKVWHDYPAFRITTVGEAIGYLHARKHIQFSGVGNLEEYLRA
jgi:hypothetical protein